MAGESPKVSGVNGTTPPSIKRKQVGHRLWGWSLAREGIPIVVLIQTRLSSRSKKESYRYKRKWGWHWYWIHFCKSEVKTFPVIVSKSLPITLGEWSPFNCSFYFSFHEWFELSLFEEGILIVVQNNNMLCFLRPFCWAFVYLIVEYLLDLVCVQWTDPAFALLEPLSCDWATLGGSRNVNASAYLRKIDCCYVPVWIKLPQLPMPFFNASALNRIGAALGNILRIDDRTLGLTHPMFARLCIELDLSQP